MTDLNHQSQTKSWINRHPGWTTILVIIGCFFTMGLFGSLNGVPVTPSPSVPQVEETSAPVNAACSSPTLTTDAKKFSYKQLVKDPQSFNGQVATFTGQILQIEQSGNEGILRLSVTNEGYGVWSPNDVVYVTYHQATPAVEGDVVTVVGTLSGSQTYTSTANYQITIPSMDACTITEGKAAAPAPKKTTPVTTPAPTTPSAPQSTQPSTYTTPSGAVVTPQGGVVSTPATWHTAYTFKAVTGTKTPPFTLQGTQQRIDYTCSISDSIDPNGGWFNGIVHSTTGYSNDVFANTVTCPTSNSTYEYSLSPGQYYLDLSSFNGSYAVTIEDYY